LASFALFLPLNLSLVEDLDIHPAQKDQNLIDLIGRIEGHGEDFVDFLVRNEPLLFGNGDEFLNLLLMLRVEKIRICGAHAYLF